MSGFTAGPRTVKLSKIGASVTGIVESVDTEVQMAFTADNRPDGPRFDGNGNVVMTTVILLVLQDDNGEPTSRVKLRVGDAIFTDKGKEVSRTTSGLAVAIAEGLDAAGLTSLDTGATLTVAYVDDEEATTEGYSPAKVYAVTVTV